jgi:hypothetical protein
MTKIAKAAKTARRQRRAAKRDVAYTIVAQLLAGKSAAQLKSLLKKFEALS